jgi:peptidyl-Asp metalloendopeptidase
MFQFAILVILAISASATPLYESVAKAVLSAEQQQLYDNGAGLPAVMTHQLVRFRGDLLRSSNVVTVTLPGNDDVINFTQTRFDLRSDQSFSWFGRDLNENADSVHVIFTVSADNADIFGTIRAFKSLFSLRAIGGGLAVLLEFDDQAFGEEEEPLMLVPEENEIAALSAVDANQRRQLPITYFTMIVAYTPAAAREVGNIGLYLQLAIDETNEGYRASNVALEVNATRIYQTDYTETNSFSTDLSRFRTKNDGYMDEVHGYRSTDRANIAHLIVKSASSCGVASTIMATTSTAFCLTGQNCAVGYYTFGHEMGHLQGARHDPATDPSNSPFTYGHGYIIQNRVYRTIMAYNQNGETRVLQWSNPDVSYDGYVTGEPVRSDNARVLDETASLVASWCADGNCR